MAECNNNMKKEYVSLTFSNEMQLRPEITPGQLQNYFQNSLRKTNIHLTKVFIKYNENNSSILMDTPSYIQLSYNDSVSSLGAKTSYSEQKLGDLIRTGNITIKNLDEKKIILKLKKMNSLPELPSITLNELPNELSESCLFHKKFFKSLLSTCKNLNSTILLRFSEQRFFINVLDCNINDFIQDLCFKLDHNVITNDCNSVKQFSRSKDLLKFVKVIHGDILDCNTDAIVVPYPLKKSKKMGVAFALENCLKVNLYKEVSKNDWDTINIGDIFFVSLKKNLLNYRFAILAFGPSRKLQKWYSLLKRICINILKECVNRELRSIAIPCIGTGNMGIKIKEFINAFNEAFMETHNYLSKSKLKIYIVSNQKKVTDVLVEMLKLPCMNNSPAVKENIPTIKPNLDVISKTRQSHILDVRLAKSNIRFIIQRDNIITQNVEAIVNAANVDMKHAGGLAATIAKYAGKHFSSDCYDYIKNNGRLSITDVCEIKLRDNKLHAKYVLNACGPTIICSDYVLKLKKTCFNVLKKCVTLRLRSVAIPLISTGIFGISGNDFAECMLSALLDFIKTTNNNTLKEIRLIDINNESTLLYLKNIFEVIYEKPLNEAEFCNDELERNENIRFKHVNKKLDKICFESIIGKENTILKIIHGNLVQQNTQAIVNSVDSINNENIITQAINNIAGTNYIEKYQKFIKKHGNLPTTDVCLLKLRHDNINIPIEFILIASLPPVEKNGYVDKKDLMKTFLNIFSTCNRKSIHSISLPPIGTGRYGIDICDFAECFSNSLVKFLNSGISNLYLKEICLVDINNDSLNVLTTIIKDREELNPNFKEISNFENNFENFHINSLISKQSDTRLEELGSNSSKKKEISIANEQQLKNDSDFENLQEETSVGASKKEETIFEEPQEISNLSDSNDDCPICMSPIEPEEYFVIDKCKHVFCEPCITRALKFSTCCPICGARLKEPKGDMPEGTMSHEILANEIVPGYNCPAIKITYIIPDGIHNEIAFTGTKRNAYLPDNEEGRHVLQLLQKAWKCKLTFTVGTSNTTGRSNVIVFNDIHHKTKLTGGIYKYGYPDMQYLSRVKYELASKGIE